MGLYVSTKHVVQGGLKACALSRVLAVSLAGRASSIFNGNEIEAAQRQDSGNALAAVQAAGARVERCTLPRQPRAHRGRVMDYCG